MPNYMSRAQPVRHHYNSTSGSYVHERDVAYQFIQLVHERALSLVQSNSVSEGRIRSLHSTNHMLCHISYSNAIGSRFSQSLTG